MSPPTGRPLTVHVVSHTHWDREWYRSAEEFRLALVDLVDELLDEKAPRHFLLDGQAIVLMDYLATRPERAEALGAALRAGRLEAGPWFVLGDNLIPSGEALVRNLLQGRAVLARLGARAPQALYCPDAFGHPAALPRLAAGFGAPLCVAWRGYGGAPWPPGDVARWSAADGSEVLLYHLAPDGYELGSTLPHEPAAARARWERLHAVLAPRAVLGVALLPNGADHHALQRNHGAAVAALAAAAVPDRVVESGLGDFAGAVVTRSAGRAVARVHGELRLSPDYAWSLQGTFGTRAYQKRANAQAERLLLHHVEPLAALAWWRDGRTRRHETGALWRTLLACHPHDTLCGCSIDAVARAMDQRMAEVHRAGALVAERARLAMLGHDAATARDRAAEWRPVVVLWNPVPRPRGGLAELTVDELLGEVAVGPGSGATTAAMRRPTMLQLAGVPTQELSRELLHVREESPRHYPRNRLVRRRTLLAWVPEVDALGLRTVPFGRPRASAATVPYPVRATPASLDNGRCRVWLDERGALNIAVAGRTLHDVLALEVAGDQGDLYTPSPIAGTRRLGRVARHRLVERGPLRGALRLTMVATLPAREVTSATGEVRRHRSARVSLTVDVRVTAGNETVDFAVRGTNGAEDCRVRLLVRTGVAGARVVADAAFGEVERGRPAEHAPGQGGARETTIATAPLHRYVTLASGEAAATLLSDGLAEYEADTGGAVAVTLLRAVGELSRSDLPERPGHAGWPAATPGAQCQGAFEARLALVLHAAPTDATRDAVRRAADGFLLPLVGETWRTAIDPPVAVPGARLEGEGLAFLACKEGEDGRSLVVRCLNTRGQATAGAWQLAGVREAWLARLDETPLGALVVRDGGVPFEAPPHATVTILLRR